MKALVYVLVVALTVAVMIALVTRPADTAPSKSDLASRINSACKKGYTVNDWTTGDEFTPVPAGTVKVTCARTKQPFDLYYVAVAR